MADLSITAANVVRTTSTQIENGTAGETITAGKQVYRDTADGKYKLADSNSATAAVRQPRGIALNGASDGQPMAIAKGGSLTIGATLTPGVAYYLSDTPGGICPVADVGSGEYPCIIGMATSASLLDIKIQYSGVAL